MYYLFQITEQQRLSPFFFFNDTATTEIYTLSLHDALPIFRGGARDAFQITDSGFAVRRVRIARGRERDRKSTRLNSSHSQISYAVFCLKKKKVYPIPHRCRHPQ